MHAKLLTKEAKLELLYIKWDQIVTDLRKKNKKGGYNELSPFLKYVDAIESDVKYAVLEEYLEKCKLKSFIAFS